MAQFAEDYRIVDVLLAHVVNQVSSFVEWNLPNRFRVKRITRILVEQRLVVASDASVPFDVGVVEPERVLPHKFEVLGLNSPVSILVVVDVVEVSWLEVVSRLLLPHGMVEASHLQRQHQLALLVEQSCGQHYLII